MGETSSSAISLLLDTSRASANRRSIPPTVRGRQPVTPTDGAGAVPAGGVSHCRSRAVRASIRRYYDRCARCFAEGPGQGAGSAAHGHRVKPGPNRSRGTWPSQRRGRAPEGERAVRKARAASERCGSSTLRLSALRLPSFYLEANTLDWLAQDSDADASRERDRCTFRPREAGEEDRWSSRSDRPVVGGAELVVGVGGLQRWS